MPFHSRSEGQRAWEAFLSETTPFLKVLICNWKWCDGLMILCVHQQHTGKARTHCWEIQSREMKQHVEVGGLDESKTRRKGRYKGEIKAKAGKEQQILVASNNSHRRAWPSACRHAFLTGALPGPVHLQWPNRANRLLRRPRLAPLDPPSASCSCEYIGDAVHVSKRRIRREPGVLALHQTWRHPHTRRPSQMASAKQATGGLLV